MLHYSDECRLGVEAERFDYRPGLAGNELDGTPTALLNVFPPAGSNPVLFEAAMNWNAAALRFELDLDTRDDRIWKAAANYRFDISFTNAGHTHHRLVYVDLVADPWRPASTLADLAALAPSLAFDRAEREGVVLSVMGEAEEQIRLALRARGLAPGWVADKAALDRLHRLLTLSLWYLRASGDGDGDRMEKYHIWRRRYARSLSRFLAALRLRPDAQYSQTQVCANHSGARLSP